MRAEGCREWRTALGAYALGDLAASERAGLEAHLDGCAECRAELASLESVAPLLSLADPSHSVSLSASVLQTIFDGGRLRAEVDIQRSRQRELAENYRLTVLTALKEVEDALANTGRDARQEAAQAEIIAEAERSLRLA